MQLIKGYFSFLRSSGYWKGALFNLAVFILAAILYLMTGYKTELLAMAVTTLGSYYYVSRYNRYREHEANSLRICRAQVEAQKHLKGCK